MVELVAKLPFGAKLFEYAFLCRKSWSAVVLVELVAKLPLVAKLFEYEMSRCELIHMVVVAKVMGVGVFVCVGRHVARRDMVG